MYLAIFNSPCVIPHIFQDISRFNISMNHALVIQIPHSRHLKEMRIENVIKTTLLTSDTRLTAYSITWRELQTGLY